MQSIAIVVDNLGLKDLSYFLIKEINNYKQDLDIIVFNESPYLPPIKPQFAVLQISSLYSYEHTAIATSFKTALRLLSSPSPIRKLFYLWELDWMMGIYQFDQLLNLYNNPQLELLTRTEQQQQIVKNVWDKDSKVINNFNLEQLILCLKK